MRIVNPASIGIMSFLLVAATALAEEAPAKKGPAPRLAVKTAPAAPSKDALKSPDSLKEKAPEVFRVQFVTSEGTFVVESTRAWAPNGVDRFYNLAKNGYFDDVRFFRVVPNFVVQFGIHGDPAVSGPWRNAKIGDDPVKESNKKGTVTFAMAGPNTRTTQLFINLGNNTGLDAQGFAPIGTVVSGMEVVEKLNGEYGDTLTQLQGQIQGQGNAFLAQKAPNLDYVKTATIQK